MRTHEHTRPDAAPPKAASGGAGLSAEMLTGRVLAAENHRLTLDSEEGRFEAGTAASCLLSPEAGDEVLFTLLPDGRAFVLSVLVRGHREASLEFPHGLSLSSPQPVRIASGSKITLGAPESAVNTGRLDVEAAELSAKSARLIVLAQTLKAAGEKVECCFASLFAKLGNSRRLISDHDETQAASSRLAVSGTASVQAGTVTHTAKDMVRIDAPQVHVS